MRCSELAIPKSSSPMLGNRNNVLRCPSSTPIRKSSRDKHSETMITSVVRSVPSSFSTTSCSQLVGSARTSYLTTPSLTLSSRSDHSSGTPSSTTGMIPRLSSKIKRVACLIKPINKLDGIKEDALFATYDITAPVRRLKHQTFIFREL